MAELPKIPVPWTQRWESIRLRAIPLLVFGLAAASAMYLWNRQWVTPQAIGEVYASRIDLVAQVDGILLDQPYRTWKLYDRVEAGEVVARLDPSLTVAMIETVRKEVEQAKGELAAAEEELRTELDDRRFERYREANQLAVEIERRRLQIAERQALLAEDLMQLEREQAKAVVADELAARKSPLITRLEHLEIQRLRDVAQSRIAGHRKFIADIEASLKDARARLDQHTPAEVADATRVIQPLRGTIAYQEARIKELQVQLAALEIKTPISGYIVPTAEVAATPGQQVRRGTVVFTVAADQPEYIVSYIRPSQRLRPEVGMTVAIRPRNTKQIAHAKVDRVGPQIELVPAHQLRDQKQMEWALPVRIGVPDSLKLRPGELVDLKFLPASQPAPSGDAVARTRG
jgi:multidrug resistance efflux pump